MYTYKWIELNPDDPTRPTAGVILSYKTFIIVSYIKDDISLGIYYLNLREDKEIVLFLSCNPAYKL